MSDNLRAILAVLAASAGFVLNDAIVKFLSSELPSGEIITIRGALATAMLALGVWGTNTMRPLSTFFTPMMAARLLTAAGATIFIVIALRSLPLPIVTTILQAAPLTVTAGAALLLGEAVGWRRWMASLTGFIGVILIVRPGSAGFAAEAWTALVALAFSTLRDLSTRNLEHTIPSIFVAAGSSAVVTVAGVTLMPFEAWTMPSQQAWLLLAAAAACLLIGYVFIIVSLRMGEIAVVAPFRYVLVPLSLALGYIWWGDVPDAVAGVGIFLVIAAGLYTLHRERLGLQPA
jgi:drug/metabolite transporter (DMT)-like permease